jgi:D-alanyl-D-alanine carboxypeptidase
MGSIATLNGFASSEPPDMHGKACYGRGRATREYLAAVQRVRVAAMPGGAPQSEVVPERVSLLDNAKKKGKAAMNAAADGVRAGLATVAVYVGRAPGWSGPVAQARPANTPVGTPPPVTAYAPEVKPTVLDGSAPPIAASAADALPMRRAAAEPTAKPSAVAGREDADADVDASPKVKRPAKHAKVAHHRRHVRTTDGRHGGKHKRVAAAKPLAEGDGGGKSPTPAHSGRRPEGE